MATNGNASALPAETVLSAQIESLAVEVTGWSERFLDSGAWGWDDYEQVRYAPLHAAMALRGLAGRITVERAVSGKPFTIAQHALADHHAAFRDMQAMLLGMFPLAEEAIGAAPSPGEWSVRAIVAHVHEVERYFLATILNALDGGPAEELNPEQIAARTGEPVSIMSSGTLTEIWEAYASVHRKVQAWLINLSDAEVQTPSTMWEAAPYPVLFRMQRFAAHLREHTNQIEKTLRALDKSPGEGQMLARQMLAALAEVEGLRLGMGDLGVVACDHLANELGARFASLAAVRADVQRFVEAVVTGDLETTVALLAANAGLAYTRTDDGVSALLSSLYRGHREIALALQKSGMRMTLHEACSMGDTNRVGRILGWVPDEINAFSSDGYTPLQLACFFGRTDTVPLLLERGADVLAVSRNAMGIQPLHAAVAGRHLEIARILIAAGANVNARQEGGFTPLNAAMQNEDAPIEALLREAGAVDTPPE